MKKKRNNKLKALKIWFALWILILVIAYNPINADDFYLSKNITQIWETITIEWDCASWSIFSMDNNIWIIELNEIKIQNVWETKIKEITTNCNNTWSINLISTEDGKPYFMSIDDFNLFTLWELLFIWALLFISWFILFIKK